MKKKYYVSKILQANGDHEVHTDGCTYFPRPENRIDLGEYDSCQDAVKTAKKHYSKVNGCYYCTNPCHTT